ncbi:hypothetical protein SAY87_008310 [Trapa incisa]|uniref:Pentatricopeptide repeat-containing protein n=1 Tax=Trapa incisa TaxID=236973 RepID=A0AAN7QGL8_9MYRT|nr:hypothetical protein SAY87_008310 [Trapa incisa]
MLKEDVEPNEITFVCALSSCEKIGALDTGACVHQCLLKRGLCRNNRAVRNALLDMYAKCGDMASTSKLFAEVGERDLLTWSIMIWALAFHGFFEDALDCFEQMKSTERQWSLLEIRYKESRSCRLSTPSMYSQPLHQAPARINSKLGIGDFDGTAIFPWTSLPRRTYASSLVMRVHMVQAGLCKN